MYWFTGWTVLWTAVVIANYQNMIYYSRKAYRKHEAFGGRLPRWGIYAVSFGVLGTLYYVFMPLLVVCGSGFLFRNDPTQDHIDRIVDNGPNSE